MPAIAFEKHLPKLFLQQLDEHDPDLPFTVRMPAVVMLTDIAGFSGLALELTRDGAHGAESLQQILDSYFGSLGALVGRFGGDISTFAGDSMIALWPQGRDPQHSAALAVQCALSIQEASKRWGLGHGVDLSQRIGVGCGEILLSKLGGVDGKWLNVVAGRPVADAGRACDITAPGQVLLTSPVAALLAGRLHGEAADEGHLRALRLDRPPAPPDAAPAAPPARDPARLAAYMPDVLVRRAGAGQDDWLAEFRVVTVMFVKLDYAEFAAADGPDRLQRMSATIQRATARFGGALPYAQMDDKGLSFIIAHGIPAAAYEDDAARCLGTALEIQRSLREIGMRPAIGVATGTLYCGECGAEHRRQYSMIGPAINLAARLAGATPDDLLCDEETTRAAGARLSFTIAQNVRPKHADSTIVAFRPEWRQTAPAQGHVGALIGRRAEMAQLIDRLRHAGAEGAARVLISGEPGIGKSRLLRELRGEAQGQGLRVVAGEAQSLERKTPYFIWREMLRALLQTLSQPGEPWRDTACRHLSDDTKLLSWAPLLNDLLPLALPETDLTREMRGTARASSVQSLLLQLFDCACREGPLLLLVDDLHWVDEASGAVLRVLAERARGLPIVIGTRPLDEYDNHVAAAICRLPGLQRHVLGQLAPAQTAEMVGSLYGVQGVPALLSELIHRRCEGNPFYIEQLALALREAGHIEIVGGRCQIKGNIAEGVAHAMPGNVRGVIAGRVDRLGDDLQLVLKVASVFGRVFTRAGLTAIEPLAEKSPQVAELLANLVNHSLITPEPGATAERYAFAHALVQEAIYELLPMAQRKRQHRRIADWLEDQHGGRMAGFFGLLANHCLLAEEHPRAVAHLEGGAVTAIRQSAYREAIQHVELAQRIADESKVEADAQRRARWHGLLGDSHHELSEYGVARRHYLKALELLGQAYTPSPAARLGGILANLARQSWSGRKAMAAAASGLAAGEDTRRALASHAYARLAEIYYHENNPLTVLHLTLLSVNEAERAESAPEMTAGYGALAIAFGQAGMLGVARRYAQHAIALAESRPVDVNGIAYAHLLSAVHASSQCDWAVLDRSGARAEALYAGLGDGFRRASAQALLAIGQVQRGRYEEAGAWLDCMAAYGVTDAPARVEGWRLDTGLQISIARGQPTPADIEQRMRVAAQVESRVDRLMAIGTCASAWLRLDEPKRALECAEQGLELLLERAPVAGAGYIYGPLGVVEALLAGSAIVERSKAAEHAAKTARACKMLRTYTQQVPSTRPRGLYLLGCQALRTGSPRAATASWRRAAAAGQALGMPYDQAVALLALARQLPAPSRQLDEAQQIFASLRVPQPAEVQPAIT